MEVLGIRPAKASCIRRRVAAIASCAPEQLEEPSKRLKEFNEQARQLNHSKALMKHDVNLVLHL
ncbi:hypothetical protein GNX71_28630 [Variovorax sp. RKNM96]|nr:hypothetical protein GNX71_28630 [Variovorax sp. RKNM96]